MKQQKSGRWSIRATAYTLCGLAVAMAIIIAVYFVTHKVDTNKANLVPVKMDTKVFKSFPQSTPPVSAYGVLEIAGTGWNEPRVKLELLSVVNSGRYNIARIILHRYPSNGNGVQQYYEGQQVTAGQIMSAKIQYITDPAVGDGNSIRMEICDSNDLSEKVVQHILNKYMLTPGLELLGFQRQFCTGNPGKNKYLKDTVVYYRDKNKMAQAVVN